MIIVSQDKKTILNFDNSTTIRMYKTSRGYEIDTCLTNGNTSDLGEYATEERAKEVLQEIIETYKATETFKAISNRISDEVGAIAIENGFVYEMPE